MLPSGYDARRPVVADAARVAALIADFEQSMFQDRETTVDDVTGEWEGPGFSLERAWLAVAPGGALAGYATAGWHERGTQLFGDGYTHPAHAGRGVGSWLVDRIEEEQERLVAQEDPRGRVIAFTIALGQDEAALNLLASRGYRIYRRDWLMRIDLHPAMAFPKAPPGLTIGPIDFDRDIAAVHRVVEESFARHQNRAQHPFDEWVKMVMSHPRSDPTLWRAVRDDGRIVGVCINVEGDPAPMVRTLGVLESHRGRGVGEALLRSAFAVFAERGRSIVDLHVDSQNATGATRLYQRCGMRVQREYVFHERVVRDA